MRESSSGTSDARSRRVALTVGVVLMWLVATSLQAQLPPEVIDSTDLSGPTIDDFTTHTFSVRAGGIGSVVSRQIVRRFSAPIDTIKVTIVDGQADDIGFVGSRQVTDAKPVCGGVGSVQGDIDVSDQVTKDGDEARLTLSAEENCCCVTGWGSATQGDRSDARLHWEVTLLQETYEVEFDSFIPANNVEGPPGSSCGRGRDRQRLYFEGDDRGFQPGGSYRTRQKVTLTIVDDDPDGGIVDGSVENLVGTTRSYAADALVDGTIDGDDRDGVLLDCHLQHDEDTASNADMSVTPLAGGQGSVLVWLRGGPGNPLVHPSCDIDWNLFLRLTDTEDGVVWALVGSHDSFPAYEIYINGEEIYRHDPGPPPYGFLDLLGLCTNGTSVSTSGTLP